VKAINHKCGCGKSFFNDPTILRAISKITSFTFLLYFKNIIINLSALVPLIIAMMAIVLPFAFLLVIMVYKPSLKKAASSMEIKAII
jgi:hypothetical protein